LAQLTIASGCVSPDTLLTIVKNCPDLKRIVLNKGEIKPGKLVGFCDILLAGKNLQILDLSNVVHLKNLFTFSPPQEFCSQLVEIDISIQAELSKIPYFDISLQDFNLVLNTLSKVTTLKVFRARGLKASSETFQEFILSCKELQHIDLQHSHLSKPGFQALGKASKAEWVDISHCANLDNDCISDIFAGCSNLETLVIIGNSVPLPQTSKKNNIRIISNE